MLATTGAPAVLTVRATIAVVFADCIALAFAAALGVRAGDRKNRKAIALGTLLTPMSLAACALYTRSFAASAYDECYAMAVPGLVALGGLFAITSLPGVALDRKTGLITLGRSFAGCALVRALLHDRIAHRKLRRHSDGNVFGARSRGYQIGKRVVDLMLTAAVAPVATFVGSAVALAILCEGGGPVFFVQQRVGLNGRPFNLFKFRSMHATAGEAWAVVNDSRVTRVGRVLRATSLDELPQLINVFRGEMSLVGPRPEMTAYAQVFARRHLQYADRTRVRPGITGWAQVTLPRVLTDEDTADVLAADLFYVANRSFVFDGAIIVKTALEVLFHRVA